MLVADPPRAIDQVGFRHAVDAPIDPDPAAVVGADQDIGIAQLGDVGLGGGRLSFQSSP